MSNVPESKVYNKRNLRNQQQDALAPEIKTANMICQVDTALSMTMSAQTTLSFNHYSLGNFGAASNRSIIGVLLPLKVFRRARFCFFALS